MRFWNRLRDPDVPTTRSRSVTNLPAGSAFSQFGQRPMFSVPGPDQPPPEEGRLNSEARLDDVVPTDESVGSEARTEWGHEETPIVLIRVSHYNVSYPPTSDQLDLIFGTQPAGFMALVVDGGVGSSGNTWLIFRTTGYWRYELLGRAL